MYTTSIVSVNTTIPQVHNQNKQKQVKTTDMLTLLNSLN